MCGENDLVFFDAKMAHTEKKRTNIVDFVHQSHFDIFILQLIPNPRETFEQVNENRVRYSTLTCGSSKGNFKRIPIAYKYILYFNKQKMLRFTKLNHSFR